MTAPIVQPTGPAERRRLVNRRAHEVLNHWGQVVIRQEREWDEEDDVYVRFNVESLPKVIAKLQALLRGEETS
jgi:hypothetical protein